jgi:hypothetical protein
VERRTERFGGQPVTRKVPLLSTAMLYAPVEPAGAGVATARTIPAYLVIIV